MDLTLASYIFYAVIALMAALAVASYLYLHKHSMPPATRLFTVFVALNFLCDGGSKAWFAAWRMLGKPPGMVDHIAVDFFTYTAAICVAGAFWFWMRGRIGDACAVFLGVLALIVAFVGAGVT